MTDEELKKKIIEVIDCLWIDYPPESGEVADALIDAGLKFGTIVSHTATFNNALLERLNILERENAELKARLKELQGGNE